MTPQLLTASTCDDVHLCEHAIIPAAAPHQYHRLYDVMGEAHFTTQKIHSFTIKSRTRVNNLQLEDGMRKNNLCITNFYFKTQRKIIPGFTQYRIKL